MSENRVIRPAAVLSEAAARRILAGLAGEDITRGGLWSTSATMWQRYDTQWDGTGGMRGSAQLVGSIAVIYDSPQRHSITVYRASLTERGAALGWTVDALCDEAFAHARLTLASCPRAALGAPPPPDPFRAGLPARLPVSPQTGRALPAP